MVTKSTQTQSGGKYDGQVREKKRSKKGKKQKGYTTERFMPVIMLIFQIKRINLRPKKTLVVSFSCFLKIPKNWVCQTILIEEKKGDPLLIWVLSFLRV